MLWKCGAILKSKNILSFPSLKELETESGLKKYSECDDRWFLNLISQKNNPESIQSIAKRILERRPYVETYSPLVIKKRTFHEKEKSKDSHERLKHIEKEIIKKLPELGIEESEFLIDDISQSPYTLMCNFDISDGDDLGGYSIQIYYKNGKVIEPIEKRSSIVMLWQQINHQ